MSRIRTLRGRAGGGRAESPAVSAPADRPIAQPATARQSARPPAARQGAQPPSARQGAEPPSARSGLLDRLARVAVVAAARRWPADLSEIMAHEWRAELDAIRTDPELTPPTRIRRTIAFAGSLALSPAVEEAGTAPVTPMDRATAAARPVAAALAVTLLAAALFNAVHLVYHHAHLAPTGAIGVLAVAALIMVALAGRRGTPIGPPTASTHPVRTTALLGLAMYAFLLAGNRVAVMPFMGWIDILPAVATWTVLTATTAVLATRLIAAGHRRLAILVAAAGGLITLDLTAIAGSTHAAAVLGIDLGSSPAWLPLALLPGGTATFGAYFADGTAAFGGLRGSGPAFHASTILLGNTSAMIGPLVLSSVYLLVRTVRKPIAASGLPTWAARTRFDPRIPLAAGAAILAIAAGDLIRRSNDSIDATLHRMLDNSNVFGFGFLAEMPGRIAVALLIGLLIAHAGEPARRRPATS